jgi:hypothetical protein
MRDNRATKAAANTIMLPACSAMRASPEIREAEPEIKK